VLDSPGKLALGLLTGVLFGFILQKSRAAKHSVIVGQLVLRDWTVTRIMGTAVAVGSVGVYALVALGMTSLDVKPAQLGGVMVGALLFGVGMAVLGYCPGTTVAAMGEGRRDAMAGFAGMLVGAAVFVAGYRQLEQLQKSIADWGKVTWPEVTATSPWPWIVGLGLVALVAWALARRRGAPPRARPRRAAASWA
jgi:uncharacterized membrane protein YedE/YeeE